MWSESDEVDEGDFIYRIVPPVPKQDADKEAKLSRATDEAVRIWHRLRNIPFEEWKLGSSRVVEITGFDPEYRRYRGYRVDLQSPCFWAYQGPCPHPGGTAPTFASVTADKEIKKFPSQIQVKHVQNGLNLSLQSDPKKSYHIEIRRIKKKDREKDREKDKSKLKPTQGCPEPREGCKGPTFIRRIKQLTKDGQEYFRCSERPIMRMAGRTLPFTPGLEEPLILDKLRNVHDMVFEKTTKPLRPELCHAYPVPSKAGPGGVELHGQYALGTASPALGSNLLCFDRVGGFLLQYAPSRRAGSMAFTDFELESALEFVQQNGEGGVSFSLEPIDPQKHDAPGDSVDGLYQEKWYSHESLKTNPFGYWMWRADWKLKQLVQGALHDDVTGKREALKPGVRVPEDFPDPCELREQGRSRCWIVCRGITLHVIGENVIVIKPDDVKMGVEERRMILNKAKNTFEDSIEQPDEASPEVRYIDRNYDLVAIYHEELWHCKRMAMLLAVANYLMKHSLRAKSLTFRTPKSSIPEDFGDCSVPVIKAVHQRGLKQKEELDRCKEVLQGLELELKEQQKSVDRQKEQLHFAEDRLKRQHVDRYSQQSVEKYNHMVGECNSARDKFNAQVRLHNEIRNGYNAAVDTCKSAVKAYNDVASSRTVKGGVDLDNKKVDVKRVDLNVDEPEILQHLRVLAEEAYGNPSKDHWSHGHSSVVQDIEDQKDVDLTILPLTSPIAPLQMQMDQQVVLHSLKQQDLNGQTGVLKSTRADENGRYLVQVEDKQVRIRRRNFLLPSEVRVVGLKDCSLNGLCGQIVGVRASETGLRYVVSLPVPHGEKALQPKNVLLPLGSTAALPSNDNPDGLEVKLQEFLPLEKDGERKCLVQLPNGKPREVPVGSLMA